MKKSSKSKNTNQYFQTFKKGFIHGLSLTNFGLYPVIYFIISNIFKKSYSDKEIITTKNLIIICILNFVLLCAGAAVSNFTVYITKINDWGTLFTVTLSFIVVYATFSALSFTYVLALGSGSDDSKNSISVKKSGEYFLLSACFSIMGFGLIYISKIFEILFGSYINFVDYNWIYYFYYGLTLVLLLYSVIYFLSGLLMLFNSLRHNLVFK